MSRAPPLHAVLPAHVAPPRRGTLQPARRPAALRHGWRRASGAARLAVGGAASRAAPGEDVGASAWLPPPQPADLGRVSQRRGAAPPLAFRAAAAVHAARWRSAASSGGAAGGTRLQADLGHGSRCRGGRSLAMAPGGAAGGEPRRRRRPPLLLLLLLLVLLPLAAARPGGRASPAFASASSPPTPSPPLYLYLLYRWERVPRHGVCRVEPGGDLGGAGWPRRRAGIHGGQGAPCDAAPPGGRGVVLHQDLHGERSCCRRRPSPQGSSSTATLSLLRIPSGIPEVENRVVGVPCGVMDHMASACGEANKLLAMVCQPAEVAELVNIPINSYTF
ncbi:translation initiation factor IF-2-like [Panicum virgatum]|uniref:translation initiation factor IF-2-like n=1 Tax=Panicum virgatum TaxID=38727 RepID=UPI0019D5DD5E|nr:translation initiation factor IF-2-like [Panicum virgatum]